jgi:hypothetical protein
MVFFACNSCGSSLKKNQVDKHTFQCRMTTVSCMDCQKDFGLVLVSIYDEEFGKKVFCMNLIEQLFFYVFTCQAEGVWRTHEVH